MKVNIWTLFSSIYCICMGIAYNARFLLSMSFFAISVIFILLTVIKYKKNIHNDKSMEHHPQLDNYLKQLMAAGKKVKAIKYYRKNTGAGLKEAYDYIEQLCSAI